MYVYVCEPLVQVGLNVEVHICTHSFIDYRYFPLGEMNAILKGWTSIPFKCKQISNISILISFTTVFAMVTISGGNKCDAMAFNY